MNYFKCDVRMSKRKVMSLDEAVAIIADSDSEEEMAGFQSDSDDDYEPIPDT